jgi:hypothetical protein
LAGIGAARKEAFGCESTPDKDPFWGRKNPAKLALAFPDLQAKSQFNYPATKPDAETFVLVQAPSLIGRRQL